VKKGDTVEFLKEPWFSMKYIGLRGKVTRIYQVIPRFILVTVRFPPRLAEDRKLCQTIEVRSWFLRVVSALDKLAEL
jgi:hypothetical protein